jgi:hypothetical protein
MSREGARFQSGSRGLTPQKRPGAPSTEQTVRTNAVTTGPTHIDGMITAQGHAVRQTGIRLGTRCVRNCVDRRRFKEMKDSGYPRTEKPGPSRTEGDPKSLPKTTSVGFGAAQDHDTANDTLLAEHAPQRDIQPMFDSK